MDLIAPADDSLEPNGERALIDLEQKRRVSQSIDQMEMASPDVQSLAHQNDFTKSAEMAA